MNLDGDTSARSALYPLSVHEALQRVTEIEIIVKKVAEEIGTGRHRSSWSGTGSDFREIREYQFGDDIRTIDWNSTARFSEPHVRECAEEHDMAVYLVVDRSASGTFGTQRSKDETIFEIAVSIMVSAQRSGDPTGICLFTDDIEVFIPAGKGRRHTAVLLDTLIRHRPASSRTDVGKTLSRLFSKITKRALIILLSDFDSGSFRDEMLLLSRRHEVRAIRVKDRTEYDIPDVGYLLIRDPENGEEIVINTSDREFRENFRALSAAKEEAITTIFNDSGIRPLEIFTDDDYVTSLKTYFRLGGKVAE